MNKDEQDIEILNVEEYRKLENNPLYQAVAEYWDFFENTDIQSVQRKFVISATMALKFRSAYNYHKKSGGNK